MIANSKHVVGLAACAAVALALGPHLTSYYAVDVPEAVPGPAGGGDPFIMLGPPEGQGWYEASSDVYQLGIGGHVVLELDKPAIDGPGVDLIVYENPFTVLGTVWTNWVEAMTVEVSTDGSSWAAFPTSFTGPVGPYLDGTTFLGADANWYRGFAGVMPVAANEDDCVDPMHVVRGGGDAYDLAELADHPLVLSGELELDDVRFVRLTDVEAGVDLDSSGHVVWDCGFPSGASADVDAVAAVNTSPTLLAGRPRVEMTYDGAFVTLELEDTDGLWDIKTNITASWNGAEVNFYPLLPLFACLEVSSTRVLLAMGPFPPDFDPTLLKIAAEDHFGQIGGDYVYVP